MVVDVEIKLVLRPLQRLGGPVAHAGSINLPKRLFDVAAGEGSLRSTQDAEHPRVVARGKMQAVVVPEAAEESSAQLLPCVDGLVLQVHQPCEDWTLDCQVEVPHEASVEPPADNILFLILP